MKNSKISLPQYEVFKQADKQICCDECEHVWLATETVMHNDVVKNESGQEMVIHFFLCPECKKIYVIDIIGNRMRVYLERISKLEKKITRGQKRKLIVSEEVSKRDQLREQMISYHTALKNKYSKHLNLRFEEANH